MDEIGDNLAAGDELTRPKVYISGPITKGDRNWNVYQAFDAQRRLMLAGFAPLNPIASCCYPFAWQDNMPHDLWIGADLPWVESSDAVLRLPGDSTGADEEVYHAERCGIPVFTNLTELLEWKRERDHHERTRREAVAG